MEDFEMALLRERAAKAIVEFPTVDQAAASVGVDAPTLVSWLDDPAFLSLVERAARNLPVLTSVRLIQSAHDAVVVLADIMRDAGNPASARVAAADQLLDRAATVNIGAAVGQLQQQATSLDRISSMTNILAITFYKAQNYRLGLFPEYEPIYAFLQSHYPDVFLPIEDSRRCKPSPCPEYLTRAVAEAGKGDT